MSYIELDSVVKNYGKVEVLKGVDLKVEKNSVACLIGPSGCGKSTMLRCINGLEQINDGHLWVGNVDLSEPLVDLIALRKRVAMVFQQFNLFPHMSALDNVALGPRRIQGRSKEEAREIARERLERVGLGTMAHRYSDALSGGQQQRVAIARALAMQPEVLLLDEVTSALDPEMVGEVLDIIGELASEGMTMVLTTHEMDFARHVADKIHFVSDGTIHESGSPEELFGNPQREKTQQFLSRLAKAGRL